jgi:N-methylhydantoinase A/acetone carboxylase, beta subunit
MGLADIRVMKEKAVEKILTPELLPELEQTFTKLETETKQGLITESFSPTDSDLESISCYSKLSKVRLKYQGSDSVLIVDFAKNISTIKAEFETAHRQRYGFIMAKNP